MSMSSKPGARKTRDADLAPGQVVVVDLDNHRAMLWPEGPDASLVDEFLVQTLKAMGDEDRADDFRFVVIHILECAIRRFSTDMHHVRRQFQDGLGQAIGRHRSGECVLTGSIDLVGSSEPEAGTCAVRLAVIDRKTDLETAITDTLAQEQKDKRTLRHERIRVLLEREAVQDFNQEYTAAEELSHLVRLELIDRLEAPFNAAMQAGPRETYEDKKELAKWANDKLRRIGLAVKDPHGNPGILVGKMHPHSDAGRFVVNALADEEGRRQVTSTKAMGDELELTEAAPRRQRVDQSRANRRSR